MLPWMDSPTAAYHLTLPLRALYDAAAIVLLAAAISEMDGASRSRPWFAAAWVLLVVWAGRDCFVDYKRAIRAERHAAKPSGGSSPAGQGRRLTLVRS